MEREVEKANDIWLILVWIYIAAAVYSVLYSSFFFKEVIMSAIGIGLLANYFMRKRKHRDVIQTDEMGVLVILTTVIVASKIAGQLYYAKIKKEIGF